MQQREGKHVIYYLFIFDTECLQIFSQVPFINISSKLKKKKLQWLLFGVNSLFCCRFPGGGGTGEGGCRGVRGTCGRTEALGCCGRTSLARSNFLSSWAAVAWASRFPAFSNLRAGALSREEGGRIAPWRFLPGACSPAFGAERSHESSGSCCCFFSPFLILAIRTW